MKSRTFTISELARDSTNYLGLTMVPFIRLSGKWLQEAGFESGDSIRVDVEYGRLVISKVSPTGEPIEPGANPHEFTFMKELNNTDKHTPTRKDRS